MSRKACLLGATGLIGKELVRLLLNEPYYNEVHLLVRRPVAIIHPKLVVHVIDFSKADQYKAGIAGCETVFCAIGTTLKKVKGDREAYRRIDYDIAVTAASVAAAAGVFGFSLVSAVGADANNNQNFYLKLKGVVEEAVSKQRIPQVHIFRPSLLMGNRQEKRLGEGIAQFLAPVFSPLLFGKWKIYKPIQAGLVANAMLQAAKSTGKGVFIHHYPDIIQLTRGQHPV